MTQYRNPLLTNSIQRAWPLTSPPFRSGSSNNFNQPYYQSNRRPPPPSSASLPSERNFMAYNKQREGRSADDDINRMQMASAADSNVNMKDDEYSKYHRAHRDRRDLYDRIESTSPLWVNWCSFVFGVPSVDVNLPPETTFYIMCVFVFTWNEVWMVQYVQKPSHFMILILHQKP